MNRKVLIGVGIFAVVVGFSAWFGMAYRRVAFSFAGDEKAVVLSRKDGGEVARITTATKLWLKKGEHTLRTESEDYGVLKEEIMVGDEKNFVIDVVFSDEKLASLLTNEVKGALDAIVYRTYPDVMEGFSVAEGRLFMHAEWYGAVLVSKKGSADGTATTYRVVMKKNDGKWEVVGRPELVLTVHTHEGVPVEVLGGVNRIGR